MCDHCVIDTVKHRMLSRRELLRTAPAVPLAAALGTAGSAAAPAFAQAPSRVVDMTHEVNPDFPTYFGAPGISLDQQFNFAEHGFNLNVLTVNEHTGTHLDAPLHFSADGRSVAEVPVEDLVAPLAVIDIREKAASDDEAQVTPDDIKAWIAAHGDLPQRCCVAMLSGWEAHLGTAKFRNADDAGTQHYPGFHLEAAQMLIEEASCVGIASDTLSLDIGSSATFDTHYAWLPTNRWGLENLAGLDRVPAAGATIVVGAPKHSGGSGGPARVIALA